jgi:hypothetical protein
MTDAPTQVATNRPFFAASGEAFVPNPIANGPWDPKSMHGRVVIGLLAHIIEQRHRGADFVPARLTVDMFRLPNIMTPVEVKTKLIRDGLRIRVVEADFFSGSVAMARASCQLLRRTEIPKATSGRRRIGMHQSHGISRRRPIPGSACMANGPRARSWAIWARSARGGCG